MKVRSDFVSNSSSSSYIISSKFDVDEIKKTIAGHFEGENAVDIKETLDHYLDNYTVIFYNTWNLNVPTSVPNSVLDNFMDNGTIKDEKQLAEFFDFLQDKQYHITNDTGNLYQHYLMYGFDISHIGMINANTIAILEWADKRGLLWNKDREYENFQKAYDNDEINGKEYREMIASVDDNEKDYLVSYSKIMDAFKNNKMMAHITVDYEGNCDESTIHVSSCRDIINDNKFDIVISEAL